MVSLLVSVHFNIMPHLRSPERYSTDFFQVIHEIFISYIYEFWCQGIWVQPAELNVRNLTLDLPLLVSILIFFKDINRIILSFFILFIGILVQIKSKIDRVCYIQISTDKDRLHQEYIKIISARKLLDKMEVFNNRSFQP